MDQKELEQEIFKKFSKHHPDNLDIFSFKRAEPPKPDIEINSKTGKPIAFELSEIVDQGMARRLQTACNLKSLFNEHYESLPLGKKEFFNSKYGNSFIYTFFQDNLSLGKKQTSIPLIFDYLFSLDPIKKENVPKNSKLKKIVREIIIINDTITGPIFDSESGGFIDCPLLSRIEDKFKKKYQTLHPCELLLYYDLQPEIISKGKFDDACNYAEKYISNTCFERIWIFSVHDDKILKQINKNT